MEISLHDLRADYVRLARLVAAEGRRVEVRGLPTRELTGVTLVFDDPFTQFLPLGVGRSVCRTFAAVEVLDVVGGTCHPELLDRAAPGWRDVLIDRSDEAVRYAAYGPRLGPQLADVVRKLTADGATRSALAQVWREADLRHPADVPCTLHLQFLARGGVLELHVAMRSQDVWLGSAYDHFLFSQVHHTVAYLAGLTPGPYVHHVGSLHVYDRDVDAVSSLRVGPPVAERVARPLGVRFPEHPRYRDRETMRLQFGTHSLLGGYVAAAWRRANLWYDAQLVRLGVYDPLPEEVRT